MIDVLFFQYIFLFDYISLFYILINFSIIFFPFDSLFPLCPLKTSTLVRSLFWWLKSGLNLTCVAYKRWCICRQTWFSLIFKFHFYILYMHSKDDSEMLWLFRHSVKARKFKLFNMLKYSAELHFSFLSVSWISDISAFGHLQSGRYMFRQYISYSIFIFRISLLCAPRNTFQ